MAVTIVVLSGSEPGLPDLSLTLDSPRIVIGRGDGCEVRLPDPSVSSRHASLRQRGGEYVLLDEGSRNGTFHGPVRLPPQTPRVVRSGERVRVGRVWLEVRFEPAIVKGSTAAAARELALSLVSRGLASQGEEPGPRVSVLDGPDAGQALPVDVMGHTWSIASGDADIVIGDAALAKRRIEITRRGDALLLRDLGAGPPLLLDDAPLAHDDATWRAGQVLTVGRTRVAYDYVAAAALAEIERSPDEAMADDEAPSAPAGTVASSDDTPPPDDVKSLDTTPTPGPIDAVARKPKKAADAGGWGMLDSAVVILAIGVLVLSVLGGFWLLGR
ncbi:FHA domain protein [Minicystis rosea]|nr:FHA domain protein [Minicystis rosea]